MARRQIVIEGMCRQIAKEAPESLGHLTFIAEHFGLDSKEPLTFTEAGLGQAEAWYRHLAKKGFTDEPPFDRENYERLMGHFLGETLIRESGGEWHPYVGGDYTLSPVVIRFPDRGWAIDVTVMCTDLINGRSRGFRQGQALQRFFQSARKIANLRAK